MNELLPDYIKSLKVGDKVKFCREKQRYTVRAISDNFIILTKPYNLKKTVIYTIIDIKRNVRGADNLIFCNGYETDEDVKEAMEMLENGKMEVSYRNYVTLDIVISKEVK